MRPASIEATGVCAALLVAAVLAQSSDIVAVWSNVYPHTVEADGGSPKAVSVSGPDTG